MTVDIGLSDITKKNTLIIINDRFEFKRKEKHNTDTLNNL